MWHAKTAVQRLDAYTEATKRRSIQRQPAIGLTPRLGFVTDCPSLLLGPTLTRQFVQVIQGQSFPWLHASGQRPVSST
jgi:hypothetical protein